MRLSGARYQSYLVKYLVGVRMCDWNPGIDSPKVRRRRRRGNMLVLVIQRTLYWE